MNLPLTSHQSAVKLTDMQPIATIDARDLDVRVVSVAVEQVIEWAPKPAVFTITYGSEVSTVGANWIASIGRMVRPRGLSATCVNEGGVVTCRVSAG